MRLPYSHEYQRFVHKFKNTCCYTQLTSRILSAARGGEYYGPGVGQYVGRWQYQPREKCQCRNKKLCDSIRNDLYVATTKSSCFIPDHATAWYGQQQQQMRKLKNSLSQMSPKEVMKLQCRYYGNVKYQPTPPPAECLNLKLPIESVEQMPPSFQLENAKRISPEFLELLRQHDALQKKRLAMEILNSTKQTLVKPSAQEVSGPESKNRSEEPMKCDTHMNRHKTHKKGFLAQWFFCSRDQKYPAEDDNYYYRPSGQRKLLHYERSQPRIRAHDDQHPSEEKTSGEHQESKTFRSPERPRVHSHVCINEEPFPEVPSPDRVFASPERKTDLMPRLRLLKASTSDSVTDPTQLRESQASLMPRVFVPTKVAKRNQEPEIAAIKCPPKPRTYVLGKRPEIQMTKPKRPLKRKRSSPGFPENDLNPRYSIKSEIDITEITSDEDKPHYANLRPRYIVQDPGSQSSLTHRHSKRVREPKKKPKPNYIYGPVFHRGKPSMETGWQKLSQTRYSVTRPRFHDLSSDTSPPRRTQTKGILKKPAITPVLHFPKRNSRSPKNYESDSSPITSRQARYLAKKKPNADDTSDDAYIRRTHLPTCETPDAHMPRVKSSHLRCIKASEALAKENRPPKLGKCFMESKTPISANYGQPFDKTRYKESSQRLDIGLNYPSREEKQINMEKKHRLRMWATMECPKPKYSPADNDPHESLYTFKKTMSPRGSSPYHKLGYKSSSGAERDGNYRGHQMRR